MVKNLKKYKKVVLTGGHAASSAFVVAEEIKKQNKNWDIYWIGFKSSVEGENISTLSSLYFPKYGIKTFNIITGRIQRNWTLQTIPSILKIPIGFVHALWLLLKIKPDLVLSFGGFSAFPVVVMAYFLGIPIIIHEQTSVVGRANRYSSCFAKKIAISRDTSKVYFPEKKTVLTGNPIPWDIEIKSKHLSFPEKPTILITGGQSGSRAINDAVERILPSLLKISNVIHLTGLKDEDKFKKIRLSFDNNLKDKYEVYGIVDPKKYNKYFNDAFVLISRAGANTVSKIVASHKPSVLIPLPNSYLDEQQKNADFAGRYIGARILSQDDMSAEDLLKETDYIYKNWRKISEGLEKRENPDLDAAKKIVTLMQDTIK